VNKRAISFLPKDLTWFLLFIFVAAIMFFFAFKPLHDKVSQRALINVTGDVDANYIALTLPRMIVTGHAIVGTTPPSYDGKEFSELIRVMLDEKDPPELQTANAYPDYLLFLDKTIPNLVRLPYNPKELHVPERYAVVLGDSKGFLQKTCVEYTALGRVDIQTICNNLDSFSTSTGKPLPTTDRFGEEHPVMLNGQSGRSYIPTDQGVVFIQVISEYRSSP